jgi:hypothetical protein
MSDAMSRKGSFKTTAGTRAARKRHAEALAADPRWMLLKAIDRRHMRALLAWHDPLTGYLEYRTRALNLVKALDGVTEETLRTSRWRLIEAGLIVSYVPGTGHIASTYCIARSWVEAEEAAALRKRPDRPHHPELVDRTPSAVDKRPVAPAPAEEDQAPEETEQQRAEAEERLHRARLRRGIRGPVPPVLPDAGELDALRERAERETDVDLRNETITRGVALARAAIKRDSLSTSGAA